MARRSIPIRRAGTRENLLLGGDRELVWLSGLAAVYVAVQGQSVVAIALGGVFWLVTLYVLRRAAKADPRLRDVYYRFVTRYAQPVYRAHSTPFRRNTAIQIRRYG